MAPKKPIQDESAGKNAENAHSRKGEEGAAFQNQTRGALPVVSPEDIEKLVVERTAELSEENEQLKQKLANASQGSEERIGQVEEEAREADSFLRAILNNTHMMAVYLDTRFNFLWVNPAYAAACNYEPSFFPGKNHFDLYPHEENQAIFQRVADTGEPFFASAKPFEFADDPERGVTYREWSLKPTKHSRGAVTGWVITLSEVTE